MINFGLFGIIRHKQQKTNDAVFLLWLLQQKIGYFETTDIGR